jgi:L-ascorbate metabolism protein UlaG (beta-lactamase superfamily)
MVITFHGAQAVKITQGDHTIAFNPPSKKSKFSGTSFGSDITLITTNHPDFNGSDTTSRGDKESFVVRGPGEYEIKEFFIRGFTTKTNYDGKEKINTIYSLAIDGINIAFLGALDEVELSSEIKEELGEADILFVPIGGDGVLNASDAYKVAVKREPSIIIPIHYGEIGDKNALKDFLKEGGQEDTKAVDKLTVKKKDLDGREGEIVVLKN